MPGFMSGPGFPDPLFEKIEELDKLAEDNSHDFEVVTYLLTEAPIGALRVADPFLGDLTVTAREHVARVEARIKELRDPQLEGQGGAPQF